MKINIDEKLFESKSIKYGKINGNIEEYKKYAFFEQGAEKFELGEHIEFKKKEFKTELLELIQSNNIIIYSNDHRELKKHHKQNEDLINKLIKSNNEKIEKIKNGIQKVAVPKEKQVIKNVEEVENKVIGILK